MSVQHNTYVMWGVVLPYPDDDEMYDRIEPYRDSAFKPEVNGKNETTVLFDGMNGEYIAIGHVTHKTAVYGGFDDLISIGARPKRSWREGLLATLADIQVEMAKAPGWHVITHYR